MRLDFNVLWVDDQPKAIQAQITRIASYMRKNGFDFIPKLCETMDQVQAFLADGVFNDEIDLVLVDWELGEGLVGQDVIASIREKIRYKDVVFYSGKAEPPTLRNTAGDSRLEGVYCASRELLVEEVEGVFDSLVKKVLDLDHTRGIVMGATSDIDQLVGECLDAVHSHCGPEQQKAIFDDAVGTVRSYIEASAANLEKLKQMTDYGELTKDHTIFTAFHRLRVLKHSLPYASLTDAKRFQTVIGQYMNKVVPQRNILGHVVLVPQGRPDQVIGNDGKPKSLEETRNLRVLILEMRLDFRELKGLLA